MASAPDAYAAGGRSPALGGRLAWAVLTVGQFAAIVAVMQRSSLGVAATDAYARFGIAAATLAMLTVVQLAVYAALQVPVGVLIDRYGSKRLIIAGSLVMAGAQALLAVATSLPPAIAARIVLGVGDALTFISVMRLIPAWFPPERSGKVTMAVGPMNQLGFIVSATVLAAALAVAGWTPSFLLAAAISVFAALVVLVLLRDAPHGRPPRVPLGRALAVAVRNLREAWAEPGTRLAFWLGFLTLFTPMMFGVMWGYPFLVSGQGVSRETAAVLMALLALSGIGYGVTIGTVMERFPYYRSRIGIGLVCLAGAVWAAVLLWPGPAPLWLLVVLVLALPPAGIAAIMTFDFARTFNPPKRLGSAIGLVNVGGFAGTLSVIFAIGLVLQLVSPGGSTDYSLTAFKLAFATQYLFWALGIVQTLRWRARTERLLAERDPDALDALRRGTNLPPAT
jgi:predicted MFS family arabinose efflux permease